MENQLATILAFEVVPLLSSKSMRAVTSAMLIVPSVSTSPQSIQAPLSLPNKKSINSVTSAMFTSPLWSTSHTK